jgi:hypothetical protein
MSAPQVGEAGASDQVDPALPAFERLRVALEPFDCFT